MPPLPSAPGPGRPGRSMDTHTASPATGALVAAAAERNKAPILAALAPRLPPRGAVLEVASGTGQHVAWFAAATPHLTWQPTDVDASAFASVRAHAAGLTNVAPPAVLDAGADAEAWPPPPPPQTEGGAGGAAGPHYAAVFAANVTHIAPFSVTRGLMAGAARWLAPGARLMLYGPFSVDGAPATPSDAAFDASLRARDAAWGYRDIQADVAAAAAASGLALEEVVSMPANNFLLVFVKGGEGGAARK